MKPWLVSFLLFCGSLRGMCDDVSGPYRATIEALSWGSFYYEPGKLGAHQLEPNLNGFRFTSSQGQVTMQGSEANGFRLTCDRDSLTIDHYNEDLLIRWQDKTWTLHSVPGRVTLVSSFPKDTVVFDRQINAFTIRGSKGEVNVATDFGNLRVRSPLGTTTVTNDYGKLTFSGPPLDKVPYVGRGLYISFHGVGIFVDLARRFPMPELAGWVEWKPILD